MPTPWIDATEVKTDVANHLGLDDPAELGARWDSICGRATDLAHSDLRSILHEKGYTAAQAEAWDDRAEYARQLAVYHALGLGAPERQKLAESLDRREALRAALAVRVNGVPVAPTTGGSELGQPATGVLTGPAEALAAVDWFD